MRIHDLALASNHAGFASHQAAATSSIVADGSVRFRAALAGKDSVQLTPRNAQANVSADRNSIAAGTGVAAAVAATVPAAGAVIAAMLAAVAAVINLIGQVTSQAKQSEAAKRESGIGRGQRFDELVDRPYLRRLD